MYLLVTKLDPHGMENYCWLPIETYFNLELTLQANETFLDLLSLLVRGSGQSKDL